MSKVKIKFSNWWTQELRIDEFGPIFSNNPYLIKKGIELEITNNPEFIIYGTYGDFISAACSDDSSAIKILFITEPLSADFMLFDYCIGFDPYSYGDRYCYYPDFLYSPGTSISDISFDEAKNILHNKKYFCDFIYSHDGRDVSRKKYFDLLNSYKRVESAGTYLNNQPDNLAVDFKKDGDTSKYDFQSKCKFSLCIQSIDKEWFINEKIMHAIRANSIPIFYGTNKLKNIINEDRVIFINDFDSDEELLQRIIQIDNDDDLYCKIISKPFFKEQGFQKRIIDEACKFICDVFVLGKKHLINVNKERTIKKRLLAYKESYDREEKRRKSPSFRLLRKIKRLFKNNSVPETK